MRTLFMLLILAMVLPPKDIFAQETLPNFTLTYSNGKINILWLNKYPSSLTGISIQRSNDSAKNFTSIASANNPQNSVNGYTDINPPNDKLYYRLFIRFDSGAYLNTKSKRPDLNSTIDYTQIILEINRLYESNMQLKQEKLKIPKKPGPATKKTDKVEAQNRKSQTPLAVTAPVAVLDSTIVVKEANTFPSKQIFTDKTNNIVVSLPDVKTSSYRIKFFTEDHKPLFELKNVTDDYFFIEKVNFTHAGWYNFEIYKNEILLEENKFYIPRD